MKFDLKSITRKAFALLGLGAAGTAFVAGPNAGLGFILGGLLMIGSFGAGWWMTRPAADGSVSHRRIGALTSLKFPIVGALAWVLFTHFHPVAVALGGMVFAFSISLDAWLTRRSDGLTITANTAGNT